MGGFDASADFSNAGTIDIAASANAKGGSEAYAYATVDQGIGQVANGVNKATVSASNSGTIDIGASAVANSGVYAYANADINRGIAQGAVAHGYTTLTSGSGVVSVPGAASVSLTNSGTISIGANAQATIPAGSGEAYANAHIETGIRQFAGNYGIEGGTASDTLTNSGTMQIEAIANATAAAGTGNARATMDYGIRQKAVNGLASTDTITNSGTLSIVSSASALSGADGAAAKETAFGNIRTGYWPVRQRRHRRGCNRYARQQRHAADRSVGSGRPRELLACAGHHRAVRV